jgi:hypothetical protein
VPTYNEPKSYDDGQILTEAMLDEGREYRTTFLNTTKLDADNLQDGAVTEAKLGASSVATAKIQDGAITTGKINDAAVTTAKLNDGAVAFAKLAAATESRVVAYTGNGHGSTNTMVRRFSSSSVAGADITYADSATNGASFTINTTGIYAMTYSDVASGGNYEIGITVNSNGTTAVGSLSAPAKLAYGGAGASIYQSVSCVAHLTATDVIRAHTSGTPNGNVAGQVFFRICRIA